MDFLQFFSSIAWQIVFVLFLLIMVIFRKQTAKFFSEFKSVKIGKDGLELQTKIENIENRIKEVENKALLSENIAEHKSDIEILLLWEKLNKLIYYIVNELFGLTELKTNKQRISWLLENKFIVKKSKNEWFELQKTIENIDRKNIKSCQIDVKSVYFSVNELYLIFLELSDTVSDHFDNLYRNELANQSSIIDEWTRIGEKIKQTIRKYSPVLFDNINELNEKVESSVEKIFLKNQILSKNQLDTFLYFRELNKRISYFDKGAIEVYKTINIEEISNIQKEIYEKLTNIQ